VRFPAAAAIVGGAFVMAAIGLAGCDSAKDKKVSRGPSKQANAQGGLFDSVADSLDRMEQFETGQILKQICDRLNQWYLQDNPKITWQPDPLIAELPDDLRSTLAVKLLDSTQYRLPDDAWFLQESVWLRDISRAARGDQFEDLAVAERLFDWTVRNIQLEPDAEPTAQTLRHRPFEILLNGRGQARDRAWLFTLLARQQGLDVVLLGFEAYGDKPARLWLPALLSGDQLYLFDCRLGLPIPSPERKPSPEGKGVATLEQVVADPQLLRGLDLDEVHPYPVTAEDLAHTVAFVEGSPRSLSRRMALVESRLTGKRKIVLTSPGNALAQRVKKIPHVGAVRLWTWPFEIALWQSKLDDAALRAANREMFLFQALPTVVYGRSGEAIADERGLPIFQPQPTLMTARTLDFKGKYDGEGGAKSFYLKARPTDANIDRFHLPGEVLKQVRQEDVSKIEAGQILVMRRAKQNASYWLGLVHYEQQNYPEAIDFFSNRTIKATPGGPWSAGARYNLARSYEAMGENAKAIALLESDKESPQSHGNQLRARRLKDAQAPAAG
jgi:hypothetical protein